ncbi:MAG: Asp-tRNA(Asn)/Glu-tRNA(Gln) amidotransferase GatCAB subunit B, partial [Cloacibacillus evryensis]
TRLWDDAAGVTRSMRSKEGARDYRYYVEMDLAPIDAKPEYVEKIRASLPEMPWDKRDRFVKQYGLSLEESQQITEQREMADYYEEMVAAGAPAIKAANWARMEVQRLLREDAIDIAAFPVTAKDLGADREVEKKSSQHAGQRCHSPRCTAKLSLRPR